ncbi:MAG: NusG domain II-containing protein [Nitrospirae bacterium]|nr:NusG domain II-containing protein [Nitrospirota bacterium]
MLRIFRAVPLADKVLFFFMLTASLSGIFVVREALPQAADVIVEVDGRPVRTAPLSVDGTMAFNGDCGEIQVEIKNSRVRVSEAHCPNKLCVQQGWVSRGVIVCLPNNVVVFIGGRGTGTKKGLDAVTG